MRVSGPAKVRLLQPINSLMVIINPILMMCDVPANLRLGDAHPIVGGKASANDASERDEDVQFHATTSRDKETYMVAFAKGATQPRLLSSRWQPA